LVFSFIGFVNVMIVLQR